MMDDYLEFQPKEGSEDAVVGVSSFKCCVPFVLDSCVLVFRTPQLRLALAALQAFCLLQELASCTIGTNSNTRGDARFIYNAGNKRISWPVLYIYLSVPLTWCVVHPRPTRSTGDHYSGGAGVSLCVCHPGALARAERLPVFRPAITLRPRYGRVPCLRLERRFTPGGLFVLSHRHAVVCFGLSLAHLYSMYLPRYPWLCLRTPRNIHPTCLDFHVLFFAILPCARAAFYGWTTPGKIMKRPQREDAPKAPAKWVLVGHSLGVMGLELVRTRLASVAFPFLFVLLVTLFISNSRHPSLLPPRLPLPPSPRSVHRGQAGMRERRGIHGEREAHRKALKARLAVARDQGLARPVHP